MTGPHDCAGELVGCRIDRRAFLLAAACAGALTSIAGNAETAPPADAFIESLLLKMTLEEKAGQLNMELITAPSAGKSDAQKQNPDFGPANGQDAHEAQLARIAAGQVGSTLGYPGTQALIVAQQVAVTRSRLKIPLLFANDVHHGHKSVFPVALAQAASFDPELARRVARTVAIEASSAGLSATFGPMVDIGRDQRWGRVAEGAGEDVLLGSLFAAARVRGYQGDDRGGPESLLACPKHFAAYGAAESGLDYQGTSISERVLHEIYLPPFKAAFDAGAILTMASFNTIDGVPSTGNKVLLTDILRGQFGFKGAVISDYTSERELVSHGFARDEREAARLALSAGCDIGMVSGIFPKYVPELVRSGALDPALLDQAVRRILFVKREARLFQDPFHRLDAKRSAAPPPAQHAAYALEVAQKCIVMLKNDGAVLPLRKAGQRIALIGPFGADRMNLYGPWAPFKPMVPSIPLSEGLQSAMSDPSALAVIPGSETDVALEGGMESAVAAAQAADVVVLALGERSDMSGESASRVDIGLPKAQQDLAEAVAATGKPLVVVLRNGRALALEGAVRNAPAILVSWFLGNPTGPALASVLFGDVSPSGRLPVTFPQATGQEPYYYARQSSGRPAPEGAKPQFTSHFLGMQDAPLYPFGHGLTYGTVTYGATQTSSTTLARQGRLVVSAEVRNPGSRPIEEVAQLYIHDRAASIVQPVRRLVDFRRVKLGAGESQLISFELPASNLSFLNAKLQPTLEPGEFDVWIAPSARTGTPARFTLTDA